MPWGEKIFPMVSIGDTLKNNNSIPMLIRYRYRYKSIGRRRHLSRNTARLWLLYVTTKI